MVLDVIISTHDNHDKIHPVRVVPEAEERTLRNCMGYSSIVQKASMQRYT